MLAFCAYYEGVIKGSEAEFDDYVQKVHLPLVAKYPKLQQLRLLKGISRDGRAPKFYLSFELFFKDWDDFEVAKNSSERLAAVEDASKLAAMFEGDIFHSVYEMADIPVAS
ncbi:MAG: EthD family reductase [Gammaproteobacteria bacterium]|nr:EthD family reductase [Gammaproteobacteria bacterium]